MQPFPDAIAAHRISGAPCSPSSRHPVILPPHRFRKDLKKRGVYDKI